MARPSVFSALTILAIVGACAGCGSSSSTILSPSTLAGRCGIALDVSSPSISAAGGSGTVRVQTDRECSWSIPHQPSWVKLTHTLKAQGPAEIAFVVDENRSTSLRSWEVVVADQRAVIAQEAAICTWKLSPGRISIDASGGDSQATLTTEDFCSWELPAPASWIAVTPKRGTGPDEIIVRVSRNTGKARVQKIQLSNAAVVVSQREAPSSTTPAPPAPEPPGSLPVPDEPSAPPCSVTLTPDSFIASASGSSISVSAKLPNGCGWIVAGVPGWLTVSPRSGAGPATLKMAAAANSGAARSAVLTIGGREFRVDQPQLPACAYTVTPDRFTVSRKSQHRKIEVATLPYCQWSATSSASWAQVPSGSRMGSGEIEVKVDEYSGSGTRTALITIAGQNLKRQVTLTQSSD